jgi:hypothetical protein
VADGGDDREPDGGHPGRERDGELRLGDRDGDSLPGGDGRETERADLDRGVVDARVRLGEDEEESRGKGESGCERREEGGQKTEVKEGSA